MINGVKTIGTGKDMYGDKQTGIMDRGVLPALDVFLPIFEIYNIYEGIKLAEKQEMLINQIFPLVGM